MPREDETMDIRGFLSNFLPNRQAARPKPAAQTQQFGAAGQVGRQAFRGTIPNFSQQRQRFAGFGNATFQRPSAPAVSSGNQGTPVSQRSGTDAHGNSFSITDFGPGNATRTSLDQGSSRSVEMPKFEAPALSTARKFVASSPSVAPRKFELPASFQTFFARDQGNFSMPDREPISERSGTDENGNTFSIKDFGPDLRDV